jgi:hypothetical protein
LQPERQNPGTGCQECGAQPTPARHDLSAASLTEPSQSPQDYYHATRTEQRVKGKFTRRYRKQESALHQSAWMRWVFTWCAGRRGAGISRRGSRQRVDGARRGEGIGGERLTGEGAHGGVPRTASALLYGGTMTRKRCRARARRVKSIFGVDIGQPNRFRIQTQQLPIRARARRGLRTRSGGIHN